MTTNGQEMLTYNDLLELAEEEAQFDAAVELGIGAKPLTEKQIESKVQEYFSFLLEH